MVKEIGVLIVEDVEDDALLMIRELSRGGYAPRYKRVETAESLRAALHEQRWDCILSDYKLPQFNGLEALAIFRETGIDIPFIIVSGTIGEEIAVAAMKAGAHDYIMKDRRQRLVPAIERELRETAMRREKRQADADLLSAQHLMADIIEFLPDATLVIDLEGKVIAWNRAIEEMTGIKKADMLGRGDYEYALPFYGKRRPILIDLALHPQPEMEDNYTYIRRSGEILFGASFTPNLPEGKAHLSATASVLRNADGEITGAIESIRNNTERKQLEDALRDYANEISDLYNNAPCGYHSLDPDGVFLRINDTELRWLGYGRDEIVGKKKAGDLMTPESLEAFEKNFVIYKKQGWIAGVEYDLVRRDGSILPVIVNATAIMDEDGRLIMSRSTLFDNTDRKQLEQERQESFERMRKTLDGTVQAIVSVVEARDPYTAGHQRHVADLAAAIAAEIGYKSDRIEGIRMAAAIHDLGKISVPAEILSKPTKLSDVEFKLIMLHSQTGFEILKDIVFPWPVAKIVLQHHERINGSGYPQGLKGEEILPDARILAVADVVEAIACHRPYRPAWGIDNALAEIENNKGILYDPEIVDACLRLFRQKDYKIE